MDGENSGSVDSLVRSVFQNVRVQMAAMATGAHLAWAELRVVASHAGLLIGLVIVDAGMSLVSWGLILLAGVLVLMESGLSAILALVIIIVLNLIALVAICLYMRHVLEIISFRHTRNALGITPAEKRDNETSSMQIQDKHPSVPSASVD